MMLDFPDGANVSLSANSSINNIALKTVFFHIRMDSFPSANNDLVSKINAGATAGWDVFFEGQVGRLWLTYFHAYSVTGGEWHTDASTIAANTIYTISVSYDADLLADPSMYINGVLQNVTESSTPSITSVDDSAQSLVVGDIGNAIDAQITEVAIWNVILTDDEHKLLHLCNTKRTPLQVRPSALVVYYPMDDFPQGVTASGTASVRDMSSSGNNGTPASSPVGFAEPILSYT